MDNEPKQVKKVISSCCDSSALSEDTVRHVVRKRYGEIASDGTPSVDLSSSGLPSTPQEVSEYIGYSRDELQSIPEEANMGLGCGNPVALASIQPGEVIVDLGSGAGIDCFLAAQRTGKIGKVIGIDMTAEMIEKSRALAKQEGYDNVEFRLGEIEHMPVADDTADLIISNCVINLSPDKAQVFREAYRVLKPGGRMMISDIILQEELPDVIKNSVEGLVGCISGAMLKEDYIKLIETAEFEDIEIISERYAAIHSELSEEEKRNGKPKVIAGGKEIDHDFTYEDVDKLTKSIVSIEVLALKPVN
ncbi:MAG: arsenite methyltransferase [Candidatus Hodarchaeota archaeon]